MIEFNGYLTGVSEKFFFKKYVTYMQNAFIFGLVMVLPLIFMLMRIFQTFSIFYGYCAVFAYAMIAVRIKTPKGRKEITPKRIYVIGKEKRKFRLPKRFAHTRNSRRI